MKQAMIAKVRGEGKAGGFEENEVIIAKIQNYSHAMQMAMEFQNAHNADIEGAGGIAATQTSFNETYAKMMSL